MVTIRISARGEYVVLLNDHELITTCNNLKDAMTASKGYQTTFGWECGYE